MTADLSRVAIWVKTRPAWVAPAVVVFAATVLQRPATPVFDAQVYWSGASSLAHFQSPWISGMLTLRGLWTSILYLPAALLGRLVNTDSSTFFILLENSIALALLGSLLLPSIIARWRTVSPTVIWLSSALTWLIGVRYAPYALSDFLAATLLLTAVLLLTKENRWLIGLGGALLFIVFNLRPAYVVAALLLALLALWFKRQRAWPAAVGAVVAAVPQTLVNALHSVSWVPIPPQTAALSDQQSLWASYFVRYDTLINRNPGGPSLTWCSPHMATLAVHAPPSSALGLLGLFITHPVSSVPFLIEKFGAVLSWPVAAPYYSVNHVGNNALSAIVILLTVGGAVSLVSRGLTTHLHLSVAAIWLGAAAVIVTSAPETRFALPLVLIAILGVLLDTRWTRRKVSLTGVVCVLLGLAAYVGMRHGIPVNAALASQCVAG